MSPVYGIVTGLNGNGNAMCGDGIVLIGETCTSDFAISGFHIYIYSSRTRRVVAGARASGSMLLIAFSFRGHKNERIYCVACSEHPDQPHNLKGVGGWRRVSWNVNAEDRGCTPFL